VPETQDSSIYLNPWLKDTEEYQAGKTFEYVTAKYGWKREEILRLAGNEATIGTSLLAIKAAQEVCSNSNFYDEPKAESLIEALEAYHELNRSQHGVVVGNGMDSIIEHALMLFCNKDSSIINCPPSFIYYTFAAKRQGIEIIEAPRKLVNKRLIIDTKNIIEKIQTNTKMIFLCSPNNPDGAAIELDDVETICKIAKEKNIMIFIDHAYIDFTNKKNYEAKKLLNKFDNIIIGYTFSKAFAMAGFRVGYGIMAKGLQKKFLSLMTPFLNSKASIAAAKAALQDKEHLNTIIENNDFELPKLITELTKLGFICFESQANFILFTPDIKLVNKLGLEASLLIEKILEDLLADGIIIRKIQAIKLSNLNQACARVTIGKPEENKRFIKALTKIIN
jgi:histidinol-phosphate aminotransferase